MTRSDFIDGVDCWSELIEFGNGVDCELLYDVRHREELDDIICNDIRDEMTSLYWYQIRDALNDVQIDTEYFVQTGLLEYEELDNTDDFDRYKEDVLQWGDSCDIWELESNDDDGEDSDEPFDVFTAWEPASASYYSSMSYPVSKVSQCPAFEPSPIADLIAML